MAMGSFTAGIDVAPSGGGLAIIGGILIFIVVGFLLVVASVTVSIIFIVKYTRMKKAAQQPGALPVQPADGSGQQASARIDQAPYEPPSSPQE